jgi:hypothetical protein
MNQKLTKAQAKMFERLKKGPVRWQDTDRGETIVLNRLVDMGIAERLDTGGSWYDRWVLREVERR